MKPILFTFVAALTFAPMGVSFARQADCDSCSVSLRPLDLRQAPSDGELIRSGQLGGALSPREVKTPAGADDRLLFGQAMDAWNRHDYQAAVPLFKRHLAAYPDSAWHGEAELHLGCEDRFNGRYTQAERHFRQILVDRGGRADYSDDIACKARLRLAMLEFMRGNFDQAETMWTEMSHLDPDRRRRDHARHWLMRASLYKTEAKWVRRCAVESLICLLQASGKAEQADNLVGMPANADYGFRADELTALSAQCGLPLQGVQAQSAVGLPTPFIAHYRFNHFVTVTGRDAAGNLRLFDPILNHVVTMTPEQFAEEWSGLALIPSDRFGQSLYLASSLPLESPVL